MSSSSLVVPLTLWNRLPTAPVTVVVYKEGHVVTGLKDGHIWIYRCTVDDKGDLQLQHKVLCIGHKSAVTALTIVEGPIDGCAGNNYVLLSASEDGEVMKWCLLDGRCMTGPTRAFDGMIKSLKPLAAYAEPTKFILCSGFLNEIAILNCATLEIVRIWAGHNDWVTCTPFYDSDTRKIRLLSSNFNGILKIWIFDETMQTITKEHDNVGFLDAQGDKILELISNPYEIGVIMAITRNFIIIFIIRSGKLVDMQRIKAPNEGVFWTNGTFLAKNRVLVSTQNGDAFLYLIPSVERKYPPENNHLLTKPGLIRRSSMPNLQKSNVEKFLTPIYSRSEKPELLEIVRSGSEDSTSVTVTSVFANSSIEGKLTCWYLVAFRNRPQGVSFAWKSLSTAVKEPETDESSQRNVRESKWYMERPLSDIWPLNKHNDPNITATTIVDDDKIAFGFDNGEIRLMPISMAFMEESQTCPQMVLKGHIGKITCLLTPTINNSEHRYLVSGGEDCSVKIWSLESGKRLASFTYHSQQVTHLFESPPETCSRIRGCVVSVARDNSLAIISLEEMSCIYIFGGYPYPIRKIQWRISEHLLVLYYGDESAHFWQMNNSELYQIVTSARGLIEDESWITSSIPPSHVDGNRKNNTLTSFPIYSQIDGSSALQIFTINVKQLINDIYHYHVSQFGSRMSRTASQTEDFDEKPNVHKISSWTTNGASQSSISSQSSAVAGSEGKAIDASIVQAIISALMSWSIDSSLDKICLEKLGLKKPSTRITFGLRGANGSLSVAAPSSDVNDIWKISHTLTATNLLSIVGLTRPFLCMKGLEKYTSDIITHYCSLLPELVGAEFKHSSLVFLVKYFQDPVEDIRISARTLFSSALNSMSPAEQQSVIDYWKQFLPSVMTPDSYENQYMARSTILLGMIGADHPKVLSKKTAENIALSLLLLFHVDCKLSHRLAALELCGRGFSTWEPYFDSVAVLRTIFGFAIEADTNVATVKNMAQKVIIQIASINTPLFVSTLTYDSTHSKKPSEKNGYLKLISSFIRKRPLILYSSLPSLVESVVKSLDPNIPKMRDTVLQTTTSVLHDFVTTFPLIAFHGGSQKLAVGTLEGASIVYDLRTATRCHILEGHTKPVTAITFSSDGRTIVSCSLGEGTVRVWNPNPGFFGMIAGSLTHGSNGTVGGSRNGINGIGGYSAFQRNETSKGVKMGFKSSLSSSIKPIKTFGFNLGEDADLPISAILETVYFEWTNERTVKLYVKDSTMSFNL